ASRRLRSLAGRPRLAAPRAPAALVEPRGVKPGSPPRCGAAAERVERAAVVARAAEAAAAVGDRPPAPDLVAPDHARRDERDADQGQEVADGDDLAPRQGDDVTEEAQHRAVRELPASGEAHRVEGALLDDARRGE